MEFSFEYGNLLKDIVRNRDVFLSLVYVGILLLYIPYRLAIGLFKQTTYSKVNIVGVHYLVTTWLIGALIIGIMQFNYVSVLKLFLVWTSVALINLSFVLNNSKLLFKLYQSFLPQ